MDNETDVLEMTDSSNVEEANTCLTNFMFGNIDKENKLEGDVLDDVSWQNWIYWL